MSKLICMGECLIDFMPVAGEELGFQGKAGGAPSNVCAAVGKLGGDAYYLGMMSTDNFGKFLLSKLKKCNVNTDYVRFTDKAGTGLAFVTLDETGDRSFTFFRNPCADMLLDPSDVDASMFEKGDILHYCSVDLVDCPTKEAHKKAIDLAIANGTYVSFDVNLRLNIWNDDEKCLATVREFIPTADVIKVTDEELELIVGKSDINEGVRALFDMAKRAKLIFVTMGAKGAMMCDRNDSIFMPAADVKVVDTTGAGDCFSGAVLYNVLMREDKDRDTITLDEMRGAFDMATKACGIIIQRRGAMESMPTLSEIENF